MMMTLKRLAAGLGLTLILAACGGTAATTPPANNTAVPSPPPNNGSYPTPAAQVRPGYPTPQPPELRPGYPTPAPLEFTEGPPFALNTPIKSTDTQVCGTGGANVPIRLVSISNNAETIAATTVGADGKFCFAVPGLAKNDTLGVMLGDLSGTEFKREQFMYSRTYTDLPNVGIIFVMAPVE